SSPCISGACARTAALAGRCNIVGEPGLRQRPEVIMGDNLTVSIMAGLGVFYLLVMLLNVGFVAYQHSVVKDRKQTLIWTAVAGVFLIHAILYFIGAGLLSHSETAFTRASDDPRLLQQNPQASDDK